MFSTFTNELKKSIYDAKKEMNELKHSYIGSEHFVLSILKHNNRLSKILNNYQITYDRFKQSVIDLIGIGTSCEDLFVYTPLFKKVLEESIDIAKNNNIDVTLESVFLSILDEAEGVAFRIFCDYDIDVDSLYDYIDNINTKVLPKNRYIDEIGIDLCKKALNNEIDPVVGREKEVDRLIEIICRKNKRNPLLIGEAGVGKTSIVEEFARRLAFNEVPIKLQNKRVVSISIASLVAGTKYRGEFEEKVLKIFDELEQCDDVIVFIDEVHTLVGAGGADGAIDASNILKPALARGKIIVIGATTTREYNKYIEEDKALSRRFQTIMVEEPNEQSLIKILNKVKNTYEEYHNVSISDDLIKYIIKLSKIYLPYRKEPDKSIDILDESCSKISTIKDKDAIKKSNYMKKILEINNMKNELLMSNNYKFLIDIRNKERDLLSKINKLNLKQMSCKSKKELTKQAVNEVVTSRSNITIYDDLSIKSVLTKLKRELKSKFVEQKTVIDTLIDYSKSILKIDKYDRPFVIDFKGINKEMMTCFAKEYGKLFDNHVMEVDLESIQSINKLLSNNDESIQKIKEYPRTLLIIHNMNNCILEIKDYINKIIKDGYILDLNDNKIYINHSVFIFIEKIKNTSIGFISTNRKESNNNILYFEDV